ncbi:hypothetical protein QYF36_013332 [Acer negundo]|nr:hypothetical protein QYF36_013332 [Acer negundo]
MEKRGVESIFMVFLILGLLVGQSPSLATCYALCFAPCVIVKGSAAKCAVICLRKCLVKPSLIDLQNDTHYFCKVGCATSLCTNLSTKEDPAAESGRLCEYMLRDMHQEVIHHLAVYTLEI